MLNHIAGGRVNRILLRLIDIDPKRLRSQRMNVRARAESVFAHVRP